MAARAIRRPQIPWGIVLAVTSVLSLVALVYYYNFAKKFGGEKERILRDRRKLAEDIGPDYRALRDKIEGWLVASATKPWVGDAIGDDAKTFAWRERPTIYARVRLGDAQTLDMTHQAAKLAAIDGLASCLLRPKGDYGPWSWGDIVARTEMLGADFTKDVTETSNDLRLQNLSYALDHYAHDDYPKARDAVRMAEYAILAVDEDPPSIPAESAAFGADATVEQKIASVPHAIRVYVYRLNDEQLLLRVRDQASADLWQVQGEATAPPPALEMRKSQALGCATANDVLEKCGISAWPSTSSSKDNPLPVPPPPAPTPSPSTSGSASK
jgi:hypothetical protein